MRVEVFHVEVCAGVATDTKKNPRFGEELVTQHREAEPSIKLE
jgi:hypothetical protein